MTEDYPDGRATDQTWHEPHRSIIGPLAITLVALAGIVGIFMLITWAAFNTK